MSKLYPFLFIKNNNKKKALCDLKYIESTRYLFVRDFYIRANELFQYLSFLYMSQR